MLAKIKMTYHLIDEAIKGGKLKDLFHQQVFRKRSATPAEMDLTAPIAFPAEALQSVGCQFVEIKMDELRAGKWTFAVPSRGFKAVRNLGRGWRCFALAKDTTIIGDVWGVTPRNGKPISHPDLRMLKIKCTEKEAYALDMLIDPAYRGKNLAVPLQRSLQATLKTEGYHKVYGYYWDDNLPALWMHRMLKFRELPKRKVSRFFFFITTETLAQSVPAVQKPK